MESYDRDSGLVTFRGFFPPFLAILVSCEMFLLFINREIKITQTQNIIFVLKLCLTPVSVDLMLKFNMCNPWIWRIFPSGFIYDLFLACRSVDVVSLIKARFHWLRGGPNLI